MNEAPNGDMASVRIQWLWRARRSGGTIVGFGVHHQRFRWGLLIIAAAILIASSSFLLDAPANARLWLSLCALGATVAAFAANSRHYQYYEVDEHARPIRALSATPPPEIAGRWPTSRRGFLT